jgi:hypothetical protein
MAGQFALIGELQAEIGISRSRADGLMRLTVLLEALAACARWPPRSKSRSNLIRGNPGWLLRARVSPLNLPTRSMKSPWRSSKRGRPSPTRMARARRRAGDVARLYPPASSEARDAPHDGGTGGDPVCLRLTGNDDERPRQLQHGQLHGPWFRRRLALLSAHVADDGLEPVSPAGGPAARGMPRSPRAQPRRG